MSTPVTLRGRLTKDPELRFSAAGKPVVKFSVVTSRRVKDQQSGEWSDKDATFWDCVAFAELANNIAESLVKGTAVIVTGNAASEEWETRDGEKRRSMKVTVDDIAPSLRWASVKVMRAERSSTNPAAGADDPWAAKDDAKGGYSDEPPF